MLSTRTTNRVTTCKPFDVHEQINASGGCFILHETSYNQLSNDRVSFLENRSLVRCKLKHSSAQLENRNIDITRFLGSTNDLNYNQQQNIKCYLCSWFQSENALKLQCKYRKNRHRRAAVNASQKRNRTYHFQRRDKDCLIQVEHISFNAGLPHSAGTHVFQRRDRTSSFRWNTCLSLSMLNQSPIFKRFLDFLNSFYKFYYSNFEIKFSFRYRLYKSF